MIRLIHLLAIAALSGGCLEVAAHAIDADLRHRHRNQVVAKAERTRVAFQRQLLARAGELRVEATEAARAGECGRVVAISQQIKQLPITDFEGGYHDTVLLADPAIADCVRPQ